MLENTAGRSLVLGRRFDSKFWLFSFKLSRGFSSKNLHSLLLKVLNSGTETTSHFTSQNDEQVNQKFSSRRYFQATPAAWTDVVGLLFLGPHSRLQVCI